MNGRTLIPQHIPSFTKPLLQALAVIVGATLVFGALWAKAETPPTTASAHVAR
jgi:hypothetical protein